MYLGWFDTILKYKFIQQEMGHHERYFNIEEILSLGGYFLPAVSAESLPLEVSSTTEIELCISYFHFSLIPA